MPFHCVRCKRPLDKDYKACPYCGEPVTDFLRRYADEPVDGKYEIVERLGAGGMGDVYKVRHTFLGATRVIKVIRPQISESQDAHDRFLREARAATKVQHPNVATLHDFSALPDGSHYMVWEYIDGENLAQRIRARGTLPPRYAVRLAIETLHGLEAIHRAGIVHRDISPENIMITNEQEERVKIIDMGVAKVEEGDGTHTRAGVFVGKLRYASPEHLGFLGEGERIDGRADLYSLGMVLYEMLTGRPPFEATSPHEYVLLHSRDTQFKPLDLPPDLPGGSQLQTILARALERDRTKRFSSAGDFAAALEEIEMTLPDPTTAKTVRMVTPAPPPPLDTYHRETVRTPAPAPPGRAGTTQKSTLIAPRARHGSTAAFVVLGFVILAMAGTIGYLVSRQTEQRPEPPARRQLPPQTGTTIEVTDPDTTTASLPITTAEREKPTLMATQTSPAPTPALVTPPARQPPAPVQTQPRPTPVPQPQPAVPLPVPQPAQPAVRAYVGGDSGNEDVNEELLANLQQQLQGVTRIAVRGSGPMYLSLIQQIRDELPSLTLADDATTIIDFDGKVERLGRGGRKRRSASATITKEGRVIFRYELHPEEYRVGDTPAELFVGILTEGFNP